MKIIQILPELHSGGVERGTLEIANALVLNGHEAIVISNGGRLVEPLENLGARHLSLPVHKKSLSSLSQVARLKQVFLTEKPDVIHVRSRVPAWLTWLAWRSLPASSRPHLVSTVHGFYSTNFYSAIMTKGERVICVSNSIKNYVLTHYPKTPASCLNVIPRGIDPALYHPNYQPSDTWLASWHQQLPHLKGKLTLLLPGRITRLKGHEDFFHLIASLLSMGLPVHGLIAGDVHPKKQNYLEELKLLVQSLNLSDHISFLGHRSDLRDVMTQSSLVCALSQQPESFGRTVLEALALGKPVVGYDCGGVGEILSEMFPIGKVPLLNPASLTHSAAQILTQRPQPSPVPFQFTLAAMCQQTLDLYSNLSQSNPLPPRP